MMKLLLLSDIHYALENLNKALRQYKEGLSIDAVLCMGDIVNMKGNGVRLL